MSLRDDFLARANKFDLQPFEVDGKVVCYVRSMSKGIKSKIESLISGDKTAKVCSDVRWLALSTCMTDETGSPLLNPQDRASFDAMNDSEIEPIFEKILEANKVTEADKVDFLKN